MTTETEDEFRRHWAERAYDRAQLAQIQAIEDHLVEYAMTAWRPMDIAPPESVLVITECDEGIVLMLKNHMGDWRTSLGQPHKPPKRWMPCPPPKKEEAKAK